MLKIPRIGANRIPGKTVVPAWQHFYASAVQFLHALGANFEFSSHTKTFGNLGRDSPITGFM